MTRIVCNEKLCVRSSFFLFVRYERIIFEILSLLFFLLTFILVTISGSVSLERHIRITCIITCSNGIIYKLIRWKDFFQIVFVFETTLEKFLWNLYFVIFVFRFFVMSLSELSITVGLTFLLYYLHDCYCYCLIVAACSWRYQSLANAAPDFSMLKY